MSVILHHAVLSVQNALPSFIYGEISSGLQCVSQLLHVKTLCFVYPAFLEDRDV